jgi:prepilin-type N-terminal cleavage/methylation domain-containing protein
MDSIRRSQLHRAPRRGFTLVELIVVIVIIAILMALILPAISAVRISVQEKAVLTDMTQLDQAITSFKNRYGVEPPSSLNVPTTAAGWSTEDRQKILRIWDQFDFSTLGGMTYPAAPISLNGAECLVFFLGGVNSTPSGTPTLIGFSKNPRTPWSTAGENRDIPFYDRFDVDRLVDVDGDTALEFLDSLPDQKLPLLYLSSQGKSYRKMNNASAFDDFDVSSGMNNPADMTGIYLGADGKTPQRPGGYQLISPGLDGIYGIGGIITDGTECVGPRAGEADNLTNFSGGRLQK